MIFIDRQEWGAQEKLKKKIIIGTEKGLIMPLQTRIMGYNSHNAPTNARFTMADLSVERPVGPSKTLSADVADKSALTDDQHFSCRLTIFFCRTPTVGPLCRSDFSVCVNSASQSSWQSSKQSETSAAFPTHRCSSNHCLANTAKTPLFADAERDKMRKLLCEENVVWWNYSTAHLLRSRAVVH